MFISKNTVFQCFVIFTLPKCTPAANEGNETAITWTPDEMRGLPPMDASWKTVRENNYIYVDKTSFIQHLTRRALWFLVRPHRFGKTSFLQMVYHFYKGDHFLFKGLSIYEDGNVKWLRIVPFNKRITISKKKWLKYPIIYLNFGKMIPARTFENFEKRIKLKLRNIATQYGINYFDEAYSISELIEMLYNKFKLPVILLIDEYDSAYHHAEFRQENHELAKNILDFWSGFYNEVKNCEAEDQLGFALVTGVSFLAMDSLSTGPNNFNDITYSKEMANAFGFTEDEIRRYFCYHIHKIAQWRVNKLVRGKKITREPKPIEIDAIYKELILWCDGYQFDMRCESEKVFNVVSTIISIETKHIANYWTRTGSILPIIRRFYELQLSLRKYKHGVRIDIDSLLQRANPSLRNMPMNTMLLSFGYLTIAEFDEDKMDQEILLTFPNKEIEETIESHLVNYDPITNDFFSVHQYDGANLKRCFNYMADIEKAMVELNNFQFFSYNFFWEQRDITTDEMPKRLQAIFTLHDIKSELEVKFCKNNSSDPAGDVDLLTLNLEVNVAVEIKCSKTVTSVAAINQLIGYYETDKLSFMEALGNPDMLNFVGLHYEIVDKKELILVDWIYLPYYDGQLQIRFMKFSSYDIEKNFRKTYKKISTSMYATQKTRRRRTQVSPRPRVAAH